MYERFTDIARKAMQLANQEAQRFNHEYVAPEHILLGLVKASGVAVNVLKNLDVDPRKVRIEVEKIVLAGPDMITMGKLPQTPYAKKVIEHAVEEARNLNHNYVGDEHLLLGLFRVEEGVAYQVLTALKLNLKETREEVLDLVGRGEPPAPVRSKTPALDSFGRDLTDLAGQGKLDPVVGRDAAYRHLIPYLIPNGRSLPVLVGAPGVGKTAVIEGLAQRIVDGEAPEFLLDRRVVAVDLSLMISGTKYRGQFEERMLALLAEARKAKVILFLDEFHLFGRPPDRDRAPGRPGRKGLAGYPSHLGDREAFTCSLKSRLARGEVTCVGATTLGDYRDWLEGGTLASHLRPIPLEPARGGAALEALRAHRDRCEAQHRVLILDEGLEAAAALSDRYLRGPAQPARAVRLLEDAAALAQLGEAAERDGMADLEELVASFQLERAQALAAHDDERAARIGERLARAEARRAALLRDAEYAAQLLELAEIIDSLDGEKERHVAESDFEKASMARERSDKARKQKERMILERRDRKTKDIEASVDWETVARIVARQAGLDLHSIASPETEAGRLLGLEARLNALVVGQEAAVSVAARVARHAWSGLKGPGRPAAGLVFVGPPGVGKTRLAACLAEALFGPGAFLEVNLSDFPEGGDLDLLGRAILGCGPCGYSRPRPPGVVMFDRLDRAPAGFWDVLGRLVEQGQVADGTGQTLDVRRTIFILSVTTDRPPPPTGDDVASGYRALRDVLESVLARRPSPTDLAWLDDLVPFRPLDRGALLAVLDIQLGGRKEWLGVTAAARDRLVDEGASTETGAHLLPRAVEILLERPLADLLPRSNPRGAVEVQVDLADPPSARGGLSFRIREGRIGPEAGPPGAPGAGADIDPVETP